MNFRTINIIAVLLVIAAGAAVLAIADRMRLGAQQAVFADFADLHRKFGPGALRIDPEAASEMLSSRVLTAHIVAALNLLLIAGGVIWGLFVVAFGLLTWMPPPREIFASGRSTMTPLPSRTTGPPISSVSPLPDPLGNAAKTSWLIVCAVLRRMMP